MELITSTLFPSDSPETDLPLALNVTAIACSGENCTGTDEEENVSLDADLNMRFVYSAVGFVGMLGNALVIGVILRFVYCLLFKNLNIKQSYVVSFSLRGRICQRIRR